MCIKIQIKVIYRSQKFFTHLLNDITFYLNLHIFPKVCWKNYYTKAKIIEKFGEKFKLFL